VEERTTDSRHVISRHVVEIRFKPDGRLLDRRGQIGEVLVDGDNIFETWAIANRIDLTSKDNSHIRAFFSHRNLGLTSFHPNDIEFFKEQTGKFIRSAWNELNNRPIHRVGIRSTFLIEIEDFDEAVKGYIRKFLNLDDDDLKQIGGQLVDVGFPLHFSDGDNRFNVSTGPMKARQAQQYISEISADNFPDVSLYLDFDYFSTAFGPSTKLQFLLEFVNTGTTKAHKMLDTICDWVMEV